MKKTRVWPALLAALVILAGCAAAPPGGERSADRGVRLYPGEYALAQRVHLRRPLAEAVCSVLLGESREEVADLVQFSRTTASYEALWRGGRPAAGRRARAGGDGAAEAGTGGLLTPSPPTHWSL